MPLPLRPSSFLPLLSFSNIPPMSPPLPGPEGDLLPHQPPLSAFASPRRKLAQGRASQPGLGGGLVHGRAGTSAVCGESFLVTPKPYPQGAGLIQMARPQCPSLSVVCHLSDAAAQASLKFELVHETSTRCQPAALSPSPESGTHIFVICCLVCICVWVPWARL